MPKPSHRDRILSEGLKLVHARGYVGSSVRDIVQAAGVPQGSFTNHFTSKEAFALEVLDLYRAVVREMAEKTLLNEALPPLERLRAWMEALIETMRSCQMKNGCMLGNLSAEAGEQSEALRLRLVETFAQMERSMGDCLKAAVKAGDLPARMDVAATATFIVSAMQGAQLIAKVERSPLPLERLRDTLFATMLHPEARLAPVPRRKAAAGV